MPAHLPPGRLRSARQTRQFVRRHRSRELLAPINAAGEESQDAEGVRLVRQMRGSHRRIVEGEW